MCDAKHDEGSDRTRLPCEYGAIWDRAPESGHTENVDKRLSSSYHAIEAVFPLLSYRILGHPASSVCHSETHATRRKYFPY